MKRPPDVEERFERLLPEVERPARYVDSEWNACHRSGEPYRAVVVYPDTYELGMANDALAILYDKLNAIDGVAAERSFVPWKDMGALLRSERIPIPSLESGVPLSAFRLVGITLPYELTYTNVLEVLDLAGIPLRSRDRAGPHPLVVGGGPCSFNPEPVAPFFDAILLGEGEEAIGDIVAAHRDAIAAGETRQESLRRLASVPGVYVPSLYEPAYENGRFAGMRAAEGIPMRVEKRVVRDLEAHRTPVCRVVPFMDVVHDRATVEVLRGCTRGCRFCQAGMVYRPVRERSADGVVRDVLAALACTGYEEVALTSLSTTDHSQLEEMLRRLTRRLEGRGVSLSLPSLRVDTFGVEMARLVGGARRVGLTFAPEAGTQRMRDTLNKGVTEEELLSAVRRAFDAGWRRVKLYFMVGLPTETDEDVLAIGGLVSRVLRTARDAVPENERGAVKVAVSVSTFVPKAHTPFQWEPLLTAEEIERRQTLLRSCMPRKGAELSWHEPGASLLEGWLARGDRRTADAVEAAWRRGAVFDAWTEEFDPGRWVQAFADAGLDPGASASRPARPGEPLPWGHLSSGVSEEYLLRERERALRGQATEDCSYAACTGCGVCPELGVEVVTATSRRTAGAGV